MGKLLMVSLACAELSHAWRCCQPPKKCRVVTPEGEGDCLFALIFITQFSLSCGH